MAMVSVDFNPLKSIVVVHVFFQLQAKCNSEKAASGHFQHFQRFKLH